MLTVQLFLTYVLLIALTIWAFLKKKKTIGFLLTAFIVISLAALWILWINSPM